MFRRRTSSSGKIHYRINIDKSMCPNPVDIYIDGDTYQSDFNGSYLDIYRNKKIEVIRIGGQIVSKDQQYEYNILLGTTGGVLERLRLCLLAVRGKRGARNETQLFRLWRGM